MNTEMGEKLYKSMNLNGVISVVVGIVVLVVGITAGVLMIVSGSMLLTQKKNILF